MAMTESDQSSAVWQNGLNQLRTLLANEVVQDLLTLGTVVGLRVNSKSQEQQKRENREVCLTEKELFEAIELLPMRRVKFGMMIVPSSAFPLISWNTASGNHTYCTDSIEAQTARTQITQPKIKIRRIVNCYIDS
jgi:hypothetical protein